MYNMCIYIYIYILFYIHIRSMRAHAACSGGGPLSEMFKVIIKIAMIKLIVICPRF